MQQQCLDWRAVRSLPLHVLTAGTQRTSPALHAAPALAAAASPRGSSTVCQAVKQRGGTYYERYLRNRKEKGGEFIGPPKGPLLLQQALLQQQQQEEAEEEDEKDEYVQGRVFEEAQQPQQRQQQQQQPHDAQSLTARPVNVMGRQNPEQLSVLTPLGFKQLIDQCLLATAPNPVGLAKLQNPDSAHNPDTDDNGALQTTTSGFSAQEPGSEADQQQQNQQQQHWLRQPWTFKDYITQEDTAQQQGVRRKRGVTIELPVIATKQPLMQLPPLPVNSSSSSSRQRVLHIFWDVGSIHPAGHDPRAIVAHLKRVCCAYGQVYSIYAYGVQKQFSWVPESFMLQYAPQRLPGRSKRQQQQSAPQQQQQQQQLESKLALLAAAGVDLDEQLGPLRCPACGKLRSNYAQLHLHMVQRHKQPPPPLFKLLPEGALDNLPATQTGVPGAAAAAAGGERDGSTMQQQQQQLDGWTNVGTSARGSSSSTAGRRSLWGQSDVMTMQNSSTRTLGRVNRYYNSQGALFEPPRGHQISLKYVLLREGVDIRLVQNQKRAVDVSLAEGLSQLLQQLLQKDADWTQQYEDAVMVMSDRGTHRNLLDRFKKAGFMALAISSTIKQYKGADVTLRWQWLVNGRYDCGDSTNASEQAKA